MRVLYPPSPKLKIHHTDLPSYERTGKWVVQYKVNGTRTLVHVLPNCQVELFTRHGGPHKLFQLTPNFKNEILSLNLQPGLEYWLDGELLHSKTKTAQYKSRIVLFDVLFCGKYLFRVDQVSRLNLLRQICGNPTTNEPHLGLALQVTENLWTLETWTDCFLEHYQRFIDQPEVEGLVLRRKDSVLDNLGTRPYDASWILRCRKPSRTYNL